MLLILLSCLLERLRGCAECVRMFLHLCTIWALSMCMAPISDPNAVLMGNHRSWAGLPVDLHPHTTTSCINWLLIGHAISAKELRAVMAPCADRIKRPISLLSKPDRAQYANTNRAGLRNCVSVHEHDSHEKYDLLRKKEVKN